MNQWNNSRMLFLWCLPVFLFLYSIPCIYAQTVSHVQIKGYDFYIEKTSNATRKIETDGRVECYATDSLSLYRSSTKESILTHLLAFRDCDSNSEALELGIYEATDSTIIFYSFWCKGGDQPVSPFGARKQVYTVNDKGGLILIDSQLYIVACSPYWTSKEGFKGVRFLYEKPKTKEDRKLFRTYILDMEKQYHARFVFGQQSDRLLEEVREVLKDEIYRNTHDWYTYESYRAFGIYK